MLKKVLPLFVVSIMLIQSCLPAIAQAKASNVDSFMLNEKEVQVTRLSRDELKVSDETGSYLVSIEDSESKRKVTVTNLADGTSNYFIYDLDNHTLYSSYTNEKIEDDIQNVITPCSKTSTRTVRYSYSTLKRALGNVITGVGVVGFVCANNPGLRFFVVGAFIVSTISSAINNNMDPSTNHGIYVVIRTTKYFRRGNHIPYRTIEQVIKLGTY